MTYIDVFFLFFFLYFNPAVIKKQHKQDTEDKQLIIPVTGIEELSMPNFTLLGTTVSLYGAKNPKIDV